MLPILWLINTASQGHWLQLRFLTDRILAGFKSTTLLLFFIVYKPVISLFFSQYVQVATVKILFEEVTKLDLTKYEHCFSIGSSCDSE
jgi:hypothetical protein